MGRWPASRDENHPHLGEVFDRAAGFQPAPPRLFMKFRGPQAHCNRRQKPIACPTLRLGYPSADLSFAVQHLHLLDAVARSLDAPGVADFFQADNLGGG